MNPKIVAYIEESLAEMGRGVVALLREQQGTGAADYRAEHAWSNGSRSVVIWSGTPNRPYIRIAAERLD